MNELEARDLAATPRSLVVTLGGDGARVTDAAGDIHIPAPSVDVVDTTGAGDAFAGTLAALLSTGASLADAVTAAVAAGSAAVGYVGAQPGTPRGMTKVKRNLGRGGILWVALAIAVVLAAGFVYVNFIPVGRYHLRMTKTRFSARKILRGLLIAAVAVVALALAFTYLVRPALTGPITEVTFHQSKPVPDYDGSTYTVTDSARLDELAALIEKHNVVPELVTASTILTGASGCTGITSTTATVTFASGRVADLQVDQPCADAEPYAGFRDEASDLLTSWKD